MAQSRQTYEDNQASVISLSMRSSVMLYGVMFITATCVSSALTRYARWTNLTANRTELVHVPNGRPTTFRDIDAIESVQRRFAK